MTAPTRSLVVLVADWPVLAAGVRLDAPAAVTFANRVVACSPAARAAGVAVGLRRRETQARCPSVVVLDHDPARDMRAFEPVAAALETLTPRIELTRAGEVTFATRGPSRYFGGDEALAGRAVDAAAEAVVHITEGPWAVHVGVADGPFAAALAARGAGDTPIVVPPGASPAFLAPRSIADLSVTADRTELVDVLQRLGMRTLGAFAALPPADVLARFGNDGQGAHRLASGLDGRPPSARRPPADLAAGTEIEPPVERVDAVAFVAKSLADDLCTRLAADGLACTRLLVTAETEHGERQERLWSDEGGLTPGFGPGAMADRVRWQVEGWLASTGRDRPTAGVAVLRLAADEVVAARGRQLGFWGGTTAADEGAQRALARLQGLLGVDAVLVPERRGGRTPGEQVRLVPAAAVGEGRADHPSAGAPWPGQVPPPYPAAVHADPLPAEVVDDAGEAVAVTGRGVATSAPARLSVGGDRWVAIDAWAGPWTSDERWWDRSAHTRRARFQVVTAAGTAHLLALHRGRWTVEATYD